MLPVVAVVIGGPGPNLAGFGYTMSVNGGTGTATESPSGTLNLTGDGVNRATADKSVPTVAGRRYRLRFLVGGSAGNGSIGTSQGGTQTVGSTVFNVGFNDLSFVATAATHWVQFAKTGAALATVTNISLRRG